MIVKLPGLLFIYFLTRTLKNASITCLKHANKINRKPHQRNRVSARNRRHEEPRKLRNVIAEILKLG